MVARFCSRCGTPTVPGDRFCRSCGETVDDPGATLAAPLAWQPATAMDGAQPLAQFDVAYPERLSRVMNGLVFIKWLLAIPHFAVLYVYGFAVMVVLVVSWFAILFTGRYPRAMFDFVVGYFRWSANIGAYILMMRDEYPPFTNAANAYPVRFSLDYPARLSRGLIFIKWLLLVPHIVVLYLLMLAAMVCVFVAWLAIIFTGRYPAGLFNFVTGVFRWSMRVNTYYYLMTDRYPPFTTAVEPGTASPRMLAA